jgi:spermidine synthase
MTIFDGLQLPKVIYETDSEFNGHIQVVQIGNTRKIKVDKIDQSISYTSPSCSRLVWGKAVQLLKENLPHTQNAMILGLGGGTMAHLLSREFPDVSITSVEIDPIMVDVARQYFDIDNIPNHKVLVTDAMRVVVEPDKYEIPRQSLDAVIVDIYNGEKYPDLGKSGNFITALRKLVKPGGVIIFNRIYLDRHQDEVNVFIEYISGYLKDVKLLVVAGYTNSDNILILGKVF